MSKTEGEDVWSKREDEGSQLAGVGEEVSHVWSGSLSSPHVSSDEKIFDTNIQNYFRGHSFIDKLQSYSVWAGVVTEVQVDVLTGQMMIVRCDLVEDTGTSISPEVDIGQVEGGPVMGLGLWTTEQLRYDQETGRLLDTDTWHYHVPTCQDIPCDLRTTFYNSGHNPGGVLGSKTTGEPSVLAGSSVLFALRMAIQSAREDAGDKEWFQFGQFHDQQS